jgi:hypothetical protein
MAIAKIEKMEIKKMKANLSAMCHFVGFPSKITNEIHKYANTATSTTMYIFFMIMPI